LAHWQAEILRLWLSNIGRSANTADIVLFRGLLDAKEDAISAGLQLLLTSAPQDGKVRATPQNDFLTASSWMQQSVPVLDDHVTVPKPGSNATPLLEGSLTADNDMQLLDYGNNFQALSNVNDQFPVPNPSPARLSSRGKEPQVEDDILETPTSHHSSALSDQWPQKVRDLIGQVISKKATKGCGHIRSHEQQTGKFKCTLGCERRFRTSADTFRHEEIVYPQHFWFCSICGDLNDPSEKHLFTREDKMRQHIKKFDHVTVNLNNCRVPNIRTLFPKKCNLCSHYWHRNWKERCKHIIYHCKKGDFAMSTNASGTGQVREQSVTGGGNDDDDDDEDGGGNDDGDEDGENNQLDDLTNQGNGEGPSNWKPNYDDEDNDGDNGDVFFGRWMRDSPGLYDYPSSIRITSLHTSNEQTDVETSIAWIKWIKKQATCENASSMFTVEVLPVVEDDAMSEPRTYFVKQYSARHHDLYEREVQALTLSEKQREYANTSLCHGTFEYVDDSGQQQYNVLLEQGRDSTGSPHPLSVGRADALFHSKSMSDMTCQKRSAVQADRLFARGWVLQEQTLAPHAINFSGSDNDLGSRSCIRFKRSTTSHARLRRRAFSRETVPRVEVLISGNRSSQSDTYNTYKHAKNTMLDPVFRHKDTVSFREGEMGDMFPLRRDTMMPSQYRNPSGMISAGPLEPLSDPLVPVFQEHKKETNTHQQASGSLPCGKWLLPSEGTCPRCYHFQDFICMPDTEGTHIPNAPVCENCGFKWFPVPGGEDAFINSHEREVIKGPEQMIQLTTVSKGRPTSRFYNPQRWFPGMAEPSGYTSVAVLMIKLDDKLDDMNIESKTQRLKAVFEKTYNFCTNLLDLDALSEQERSIARQLAQHVSSLNSSKFLVWAELVQVSGNYLLLYYQLHHRPPYTRHSVLRGRITKRYGRNEARTRSISRQTSAGRGTRAMHTWSCMLFQCDEGDESAESASC
jgi:hypothetical protein